MAEATLSAPPEAAAQPCASCSTARSGPFCAHCGQPARGGRLTLRSVSTQLVADAFDVNRGLLFTALELSRRPGAAIRAYVDGRTVRYTSPVKYFLILATFTTLVYVNSGAAAAMQSELVTGATHQAPDAERLSRVLGEAASLAVTYLSLVMAGSVPVAALATRVLFRRAGMNLAEHVVFNLYAYAHSSLLFVAALLVGTLAGVSHDASIGVYVLLSTGYFAWAARGFFQVRLLPAALRATAAMLLSTVVYSTLVLCAIGAYAAILIRRG